MSLQDFDLSREAEQQIEEIRKELVLLDRREQQLIDEAMQVLDEDTR